VQSSRVTRSVCVQDPASRLSSTVRCSVNPKVSVFIPVFKESNLLESLLKDLLIDSYSPKEIFVVIDEPTERSLDLVKRIGKKVRFILNRHRLGKVNSLNEAAKRSTGDIFLFLDSDLQLNGGVGSFLKKVADEMQDAEVLDIRKKVIRNSFTARITHYDYLCINVVSWLFCKCLGKTIGLNGAAFAVKRKAFEELGGFRRVLSEDLDIATRAFLKDYRFKFASGIDVSTETPSGLKNLYRQRKRWGLGLALWARGYYRELGMSVAHSPKILLPAIFLCCPSLLLLSLILVPEIFYYELLLGYMLLATATFGILLPPMLYTFTGVMLVKNATFSLASFGAVSVLYGFLARKLKFIFNAFEFLFFYFVFSPFWLAIVVLSLLKVCVQPNKINVDWKY
jgi:biofilm PGA synthesis N-glycosyltransferase PgaC